MSYAKLAGLHPIYGLCECLCDFSSYFCYLVLHLLVIYNNYIIQLCFYFLTDSGFVPIFMYAIFGSSRQVAIGPVALVSLLVSNVLEEIVSPSDELYTKLAILLAFMVGVMECAMGLLRFGIYFVFLYQLLACMSLHSVACMYVTAFTSLHVCHCYIEMMT